LIERGGAMEHTPHIRDFARVGQGKVRKVKGLAGVARDST
jgi:hypothetical protein